MAYFNVVQKQADAMARTSNFTLKQCRMDHLMARRTEYGTRPMDVGECEAVRLYTGFLPTSTNALELFCGPDVLGGSM